MNLFNIDLPKWPALIVKGKPVTTDQAKLILIQTDSLDPYSNDKEFEKDVNELVYGVRGSWMDKSDLLKQKLGTTDLSVIYDYEENIRKELGLLSLTYLHNSRILSCWIGGPHGWCNWNGYIGCNNYNIGKWPTVESVFNDWSTIAQTYPFLSLRSQLLSGEICEDSAPVVEFIVENGQVQIVKPTEPLDAISDDTMAHVFNIMHNPMRERGCTKEQLKEALDYVRGIKNIRALCIS